MIRTLVTFKLTLISKLQLEMNAIFYMEMYTFAGLLILFLQDVHEFGFISRKSLVLGKEIILSNRQLSLVVLLDSHQESPIHDTHNESSTDKKVLYSPKNSQSADFGRELVERPKRNIRGYPLYSFKRKITSNRGKTWKKSRTHAHQHGRWKHFSPKIFYSRGLQGDVKSERNKEGSSASMYMI